MTKHDRRRQQRWRCLAFAESHRILILPNGRVVPVIAGGGGGSEETVTRVEIPAKTEEETALLSKQTELLEIQLQEVRRQNTLLEQTFPSQKRLLDAQTQAALQQVELFKEQGALFRAAIPLLEPSASEKEIKRLSEERTLAILRGEAPPLLPGQEEQLETLFGTARKRGTEEVQRFGEEIAAARGLRLTDTPIGAEVLREKARLEEQLGTARAAATLDFGNRSVAFNESIRQFQEGLRQKSFENRLALLGRTPGPAERAMPFFGTGLAGQTFAQVSPLVDVLGRQRLVGATTRQTTGYNPGFFDYFSTILGAVAPAAGAIAMSSARLKKDIQPLDQDEYEAALLKVRETPVTRWRYTWEPEDREPHIGPILELSPKEIRQDALHVNLLDYAGLLHAGLKAVDRKVAAHEITLRDVLDRGHRRGA